MKAELEAEKEKNLYRAKLKIDSILTAEQREKMKSYEKKMKEKFREHREEFKKKMREERRKKATDDKSEKRGN